MEEAGEDVVAGEVAVEGREGFREGGGGGWRGKGERRVRLWGSGVIGWGGGGR